MKKPLTKVRGALLMLCILTFLTAPAQIPISKTFRVANFWMPGNGNGLNLTQNFNGDLQLYINQMKSLGVTHFRIGGKDYDQGNMWDDADLSKIINWLRSHGFEVIVQVPIDPNLIIAQNASRTASIVSAMNTGTLLSYPVELWEVGNEPNNYTSSTQHGDYTTDAMIANYIRACAKAMREVQGQTDIKIIGPSLNSYLPSSFQAFLTPTSPAFIAGTTTLTGISGTMKFPYIDYISFNQYPFDYAKYTDGSTPVTRQDVIDYLTSNNRMAEDLDDLKILTATASSARPGYPLGVMITEANISYEQDITNATTKGPNGLGPGSFIGGQFWAETMAIGMEKGLSSLMHWSTIEGTDQDPGAPDWITDIGLIGKEATTNTATPHLRPSYYHFQYMAHHFKGAYHTATVTGGSNIKAWGAQSGDRVAVMILNQNPGTGSSSFKLRLNQNIPPPSSGVDVLLNIPATYTNAFYASSTGTTLIENESTVLLVFTCKGNFNTRFDYDIDRATSTPDPGFQVTETGTVPLIGSQVNWSFPSQPLKLGHSGTFTFYPSDFTFAWSTSTANPCPPVPGSGNQVVLTNCAGSSPTIYTYTATNSEGCSVVQQISISEDIISGGGGNNPLVYMGTVALSNCGLPNGEAKAICSTCTGTITYGWDGATPVSSNTIGGLSPGNHTVVVNWNTNAYELRFFVGITLGTQPQLFAGFDQTAGRFCKVKLDASPVLSGHSYEWFSGNSTVPVALTPITYVTHWGSQNYRVKVTAPNGCVNEDWVFVERNSNHKCLPTGLNAMIPCDPNFNITARSMTEIETLTLSASATIEKNTYFDKILTVPAGKTLTIQHCVVAFSPSAHIIVADSGHIVIDDVLSFPCGTHLYPYYNGSGDFSTARMINSGFEGNNPPIRFENTNGTYIFDNAFARSGVAIDLADVENAEITNNLFYETQVGIRSNASNDLTSGAIQSNTFMGVGTAIDIDGGDHTLLSISCNTLEYSEYGIYSEGSLGDFGVPGNGAANYFYSGSSLVNHQVHHNGNAITYHCGATNSFVLTTDEDCDVTVSVELEDQSCPIFNERKKQTEEKPALLPVTLALTAFPNPTDGEQTIVAQVPPGDVAVLSVYEAGSVRLVFEQTITSGETRVGVDLSRYAATIFAAVLRTSAGQQKTVKLLRVL